MTGYGKAEYIFSDHKTIVELRAVNSKQLDPHNHWSAAK